MTEFETGKETQETLKGLEILQRRCDNLSASVKEMFAIIQAIQGKKGEVKTGALDKYTGIEFENNLAAMNLDLQNAMYDLLKSNGVTMTHEELAEALKKV